MVIKLFGISVELRRETTQERLERVIAERNSGENERLRREWLKPFERLWDNPEDDIYTGEKKVKK